MCRILSCPARLAISAMFFSLLIFGAPANAVELKIAKVDLKQLYVSWPRMKGLQENAEKEVLPLRKELDELVKQRAEQVKSLESLRRDSKKEEMADAEKRRLAGEVEIAMGKFQALNQKGNGLEQAIRLKLQDLSRQARTGLVKEVHAMCRLVARREKFNMLINVSVDSEGFLMAEPEVAVDITKLVQQELESRASSVPFDRPPTPERPAAAPEEESAPASLDEPISP
jgi:Skp family chaperone for outer membrane proteins